jgi:hypothetical protein
MIEDRKLGARNIQLLPVFQRRLLHITLDTPAIWGILVEAQRALPLAPPPQQEPRLRRRVRRGCKGRGRRRRGCRRFCRTRPASPEPPAVWRPWGEDNVDGWPPYSVLKGHVLAMKQLWGQLLDMPTLLQRYRTALQWE